ncbi:12826_t:CDS:2, partial [Racocetra fulgida]
YLRKKQISKDDEIVEEHEKTNKEYEKANKIPNPPSYLTIKIALRLKKIYIKDDNFAITKFIQKDPQKNFYINNQYEEFRVGASVFAEEQLVKFNQIIQSFLNHQQSNFEAKDILTEIRNNIECENPIQHNLLKNTTQYTNEEFKNLFNYYEIGKSRLYSIYKQDVLKLEEHIIKGRRASNVVIEHASKYKQELDCPIKRKRYTEVNTVRLLQNFNTITSSNTATSSMQLYEEQYYLQ